jgi:hypothetical protein
MALAATHLIDRLGALIHRLAEQSRQRKAGGDRSPPRISRSPTPDFSSDSDCGHRFRQLHARRQSDSTGRAQSIADEQDRRLKARLNPPDERPSKPRRVHKAVQVATCERLAVPHRPVCRPLRGDPNASARRRQAVRRLQQELDPKPARRPRKKQNPEPVSDAIERLARPRPTVEPREPERPPQKNREMQKRRMEQLSAVKKADQQRPAKDPRLTPTQNEQQSEAARLSSAPRRPAAAVHSKQEDPAPPDDAVLISLDDLEPPEKSEQRGTEKPVERQKASPWQEEEKEEECGSDSSEISFVFT